MSAQKTSKTAGVLVGHVGQQHLGHGQGFVAQAEARTGFANQNIEHCKLPFCVDRIVV